MSNKFFIKTTLEWASTSMNSYIIPRGDLCIETFDDGNMKLKIGDGLRVFKQLPYICHGHDDKKYDYYTKEEIDKMFDDITIDLDNYYNKIEINELMTSLRSNLIQYIDNNTHYHHNKAILDQITAPFTREEKEKLANIIDVSGYAERIEVLESIAHTHDNKNVLDLITLADVNNWHVHSNKTILDNTTASFTVNYKNILDNLVTYNVFEPASAYESGSVGLVPAPNVGDHVKFLRGDGKWVSVEAATVPIATTETLGGIIVGDGLTITPEGILSANAQQSGVLDIVNTYDVLNITFEDDTRFIKLYNPGNGIEFENASSGSALAPKIKYFRFDISKIRGNNPWVQVGELEFSHNGTVVRGNGVSIAGYKFDGSTPNYSTSIYAQTAAQMIDNDLNTKMCARFDDDGRNYMKFILSINGEGISPNELFKYQYFTGDDEPDRDPVSWQVYVSADGVRWILVDQRDDATINTTRNATAFDKITLDMTDYIDSYADRTFTNINVKPATTTEIGGVIVGDGLSVNEYGVLSASGVDTYNSGIATEIRSGIVDYPDIPPEYQYVEYIESDATQYIDTGYIHQTGNCFFIDAELLKDDALSTTQQVVFGAYTTDSGQYEKNQVSWYMNDRSIYQYTLGISPNSPASYSYTNGFYDTRVNAYLYSNKLDVHRAIDDEVVSMSVTYSVSNGANTLAIFCKHVDATYESKSKMRLHKFSIYSHLAPGDTYSDDYLIKSYYPVYRKSDGVAGLYDVISQTFVTSPVGNPFTVGSNIYPDSYKFIDVRYADGLKVNDNNELIVTPATSSALGGVIIGEGINVDANGVISVDSHDVVEYSDGDAIELRDESIVNAPFIRFNGSTSVFDTGVIHQAHDKFEVILREPTVINKTRTVFGSRIYHVDSNDITLSIDGDQQFVFDRSSTAHTMLESTNLVSTDIVYKIIIQDKSCDIYNYETGELIEHIGDAAEWVLDDGLYTLSIGNLHNRDSMQHSSLFGDMELYEFKWYRNDALIHDYVPYQNDSLVALYDNVTESVLQAYAGANGLTYGTREIHISGLGSDKTINVLYADGLAINDNNQLYTTGVLDVSVNPTDDTKLNIAFWDETKTIKIAGTKYTPGEAIDISTESLDSDYIEIEYIETYNPNNTRDFSYFDTGYIPGPTTNIELVVAPSRGATEYTPVGITRYDNGSYATHVFGIAWNSTTGKGVWFNRADQTSNYGGQYVELSEDVRNKKTIFKTVGSTLYVYNENGDLLGSVTDSDAFTANSPYSLPIFVSKIHNDSPYSNDFMYGKFYELYIREGDELVHHFIPCKTADQTAFGIYDTITKSFRQISRYGTGGQINLGPEVSERRSETKINVLYNDGLDVNDDNELINTGVLDVNVNEQDSSKLDIEFYDHTKTITIPSGYELLPATSEVLGGIIVGNGLSIDEDGVLSADAITIDDYVISVTQDEEFANILHVEYPDGTVDITLPQSEGQVEVDEPEEELIISGSYGPAGEIYTAGAGISITKASGDDRHLPDAYKQIQYIESNEFDQFLDTQILVIPGIKVECDCEVSDAVKDAYQGIFGTKYANTSNCFIFWTRFGGQNIPCFASPSSGEVTGTGFIYNTRIKIVATQSGASWYLNDSLVGSINGSGNWSYDKPIILFGAAKEGHVESGCKGKCYEFKAYNGDTLTNDLIPCVEIATGEVGMYDLIANKFCKAVDDGVTREPFVSGPDLIADSFITNTGVLDIAVNEEDETVLDVTFYNETKHIQMSGGSSYDDTELRSLISALTQQVQTLQTELNTLKTKAVLSDDIKHIDKVTMDEYTSMVRSNDTMYLINDEAGELEPSSSVVPTDTLATSMDNVDIMIIGDLEEVE